MKKNIIIAIFALLAANFAPMRAMKKGCLDLLLYGNGKHIASVAREEQSKRWGLREFLFGDGNHIEKQKVAKDTPVPPLIYKKVNAPVVTVEQPAVIENPADSAAFAAKKESVTEEQKPARKKRTRRKNAELAGL